MLTDKLLTLVLEQLDDIKGKDIKVIDVRGKTNICDYMVIATGTSQRHLKSLAEHVEEEVKKNGFKPLGIEGENTGEWIVVDLGDIIVHAMLGQTRDFYQLENLWEVDFAVAQPSQL